VPVFLDRAKGTRMAWLWPKIKDATSAADATKPAVAASAFVAAISALLASLSLMQHKPVLGFNGASLVDAALFVVIAWRTRRMSRSWSILGLVLYLVEVIFNVVDSPQAPFSLLAVIFILAYVGAIRGTFAYHRYLKAESTLQPPSALA
jgi:hypothetical protein